MPDVISFIMEFPNWYDAVSRTTDAHLMMLAEHHGAVLATLDKGIPRAFLLPRAGSVAALGVDVALSEYSHAKIQKEKTRGFSHYQFP